MSYVRKLMAHDEKLIGIARLHWIYVLKGVFWFVLLAGAGWLFNVAMSRLLMTVGQSTDSMFLPSMMMSVNNGVMFFLMGGGFLVFLLFVIDVLTTEIGLSTRRVMHKKGLVFVKVRQIDLEEIRGENLDLGYFGRVLGYGYILLDCRFIGDVRLPAIEHPERFMRALHQARAETQDTLQMVVGKTNVKAPIEFVNPEEHAQAPRPETPKPDITPGEQPVPEIQPEPTPHAPPSPQQPPSQPVVPPQPQQPVPAPGPNPQPPLQPPGSPTGAAIDPQTVAQVVAQVTPQIAHEVVEQLKEQGVLKNPAPENDNAAEEDIDKELIADFDEARFQDEDPHERFNKMEHAIH